ncbi:MAG: type II toxin-antitoxin system VapC family toxin [Methanoregula sp.]
MTHDKIILDSCVIAAIFLPEMITGKAIDAAADHDCITVDLAYTEVANAALKRAVHAGNDPGTVKSSLDNAIAFIRETCEVIPAQDLITPAWDLSCNHRIPIYDALFVAASIRCDAPLVTADKRFAGAVSKTCPVIRIE